MKGEQQKKKKEDEAEKLEKQDPWRARGGGGDLLLLCVCASLCIFLLKHSRTIRSKWTQESCFSYLLDKKEKEEKKLFTEALFTDSTIAAAGSGENKKKSKSRGTKKKK